MAPQLHSSGRDSLSAEGTESRNTPMERKYDATWAQSQAFSCFVGIEQEKDLARLRISRA